MKFKALLAAIAVSALSLSAQAVTVSQSYTLTDGDYWTHSTNGDTPQLGQYAELIASGESDIKVTVSLGYTIPQDLQVTYKLWNDNDPNPGSVDPVGEVMPIPPMTDVSPGNLIPFFTFVMQSGQKYVLEILRGEGVNTVATNISVNAVPLPGALWLFGSALLGFLGISSRRKA